MTAVTGSEQYFLSESVPGPQTRGTTESWADLYGIYTNEILYGQESKGPKLKQIWKCLLVCPYKLILDWKNLPMEYQLVPQRKVGERGMEGQMGGKGFMKIVFTKFVFWYAPTFELVKWLTKPAHNAQLHTDWFLL